MKYLDEYRDPVLAQKLMAEIHRVTTRPWTLMEVCGGQTHTIVKQGIDEMLPAGVRMIHGPGCPVCVTPLEQIDKALAIAARPDVIFTSYGDMLRVPGSATDLLALKARGADVRIVYSPLDALRIAREHPDKQVVFFAVGFETTAPANAMAVAEAARTGVDNFSVLVSHVLVPPAMIALLESPSNQVQGFLAAGHVCAVMGWTEYEPIAEKYRVPIVVTGFEPLDLLEGILMTITAAGGWPGGGREPVRSRGQARWQCARPGDGARRCSRSGSAAGEASARSPSRATDSGRPTPASTPSACSTSARSTPASIPPASRAPSSRARRRPSTAPRTASCARPRSRSGHPMVSSEGTCAAFFSAGRGIGAPARPLVQVAPIGGAAATAGAVPSGPARS